MKTEEITTLNLHVLQKIRDELVKILKHSDLKIGSHYKLSKTEDLPVFYLTIGETGLSFLNFKTILEEKISGISIKELRHKLLQIDVEKVYDEKMIELKNKPNAFKDALTSFIKENTGLTPEIIGNCGFYKITEHPSKSRRIILINCSSQKHFERIIKALEEDDYYSKRISIASGALNVEEFENYNAAEKISYVKKFLEKFTNLYLGIDKLLRIEPLPTLIASELVKNEQVKIILKFSRIDSMDIFTKKVPRSWEYEILNLTTMEINISKEDIDDFVYDRVHRFIQGDIAPDSRFVMMDEKEFSLEKEENSITSLSYINPDLSFLNEISKEPLPKPKVTLIDIDVGKTTEHLEIKPPDEVKVINQKQIKVKVSAMNKEMKEMSNQRKEFANHFVFGIRTKFPSIAEKIIIQTGRFTSTSEGFEFSTPKESKGEIEKYLKEEKKAKYTYNDGNFIVVYPERYELQKDENQKSLISFCEKERNNVRRALESANFYQKKGGKGRKGVLSVNQSATIASTKVIRICVLNKSNDTLNQVTKVVKKHYELQEKKTLVEVEQDTKEFLINVKLAPAFFPVTREAGNNPEEPEKQNNVESDIPDEADVDVMISIADEEDDALLAEIKILQNKRDEKKKEFLVSISNLMVETFWKTLEGKNILLFVSETKEGGLMNLSQISPDELKSSVALEVLEKLKLNK